MDRRLTAVQRAAPVPSLAVLAVANPSLIRVIALSENRMWCKPAVGGHACRMPTFHDLHPSDMSNDEWSCVSPFGMLMRDAAAQRAHPLRELLNGPRYVVHYGIAWRAIGLRSITAPRSHA
jgi:hypothetical protein